MFKMPFWLLSLLILTFCPTIKAKSLILIESNLNFRPDQVSYIKESLRAKEDSITYDFEIHDISSKNYDIDPAKYPEKVGLKLRFKKMELDLKNKLTLSVGLTWFDVRTNEVFKSEDFSKEVVLEAEKANAWRIVETISWKEKNRHLEESELKGFLKDLAKKIARNFILLKSPDYFLSAQGGN